MQFLENTLKQAQRFEQSGKYLHSLQLYQILLKNPKYKRVATVRLAGAYEKLNRAELAKKILQEYMAEPNDDEEVRKLYVHFLIRHSYYEEALDALSLISRETNPEIYFLMGVANFNIDEYDIAEINFTEFISNNSKSDLIPEALLFLAKTQIKLNKLNPALIAAKKSADIYFQNHELHYVIAQIYFMKGMNYHAYESIRNSIKINKDDLSIQKCAGKILLKLKEYKKALNYFLDCYDRNNFDIEVLESIGNCYMKLDRVEMAKIYFKKLLKIDPDNARISQLLKTEIYSES